MEEHEHPLPDRWVLWYHSVYDEKWDLSSYLRVDVLRTVEDVCRMLDMLVRVADRWGHFFLMREGILPMYEDPAHIEGGSWSFKVHQRKRLPDAWCMFVTGVLGGYLLPTESPIESVTGLSMNPRNGVIKVWTKTGGTSFPVVEHAPWIFQDRSIFQSHRQRL
jgi:hypothetical protein